MSLAKKVGILAGALALLIGGYIVAKKQGWIGADTDDKTTTPPVIVDTSAAPASAPVVTTDTKSTSQSDVDAQLAELQAQQAAAAKTASDLGLTLNQVSNNLGNKYSYSQIK